VNKASSVSESIDESGERDHGGLSIGALDAWDREDDSAWLAYQRSYADEMVAGVGSGSLPDGL
jgi:hypothetical protein